MHIQCSAQRIVASPPLLVYELVIDSARFPQFFTGYGPIAAVKSVVVDEPLRVGGMRTIHNADGTVLTERIGALDAPSRHTYTLSGFIAPFSWLVRVGEADWTITPSEGGCLLRWDYRFALTSPLVTPLAAPLLGIFMRGAMRRCLDNMAAYLVSADQDESV